MDERLYKRLMKSLPRNVITLKCEKDLMKKRRPWMWRYLELIFCHILVTSDPLRGYFEIRMGGKLKSGVMASMFLSISGFLY